MTRYDQILRSWEGLAAPLALAMADAGKAARQHVIASTEQEVAIRDVAAGVAAPALVGYVVWLLRRASEKGLRRLCFLSRDAQVFYEIARRLAPRLGLALELRYVYSSRRTWNLAAADPANLAAQDWLFNSFMRANAADVCTRLGLDSSAYGALLVDAGASVDPEVRADQQEQALALRRFVASPALAAAVAPSVEAMRGLVRDYALQEGIASTSTGLVDAGWTGRMIGALTTATAGLPQPQVFFWAHEPRESGWTDPARVHAFMYNTATGEGVTERVPDTPYIIETFCMSDHGIAAGYRRASDGRVDGIVETDTNPAVEEWGFGVFRETIYHFCEHLTDRDLVAAADSRDVIARVLRAFWLTPTPQEAAAWGDYPYDSDPLGRSTRPLARPFDDDHLKAVLNGAPLRQADRAWIQGSLARSGPLGAQVAELLVPSYSALGAPATD
ncbi:hypothetical protein [Actinoplanes regularis]|uniref:Uncharacterized protein n=1 Tax=Actinoplanes regularis TaxID=52697 RepID=A0A238XHY4_9ACTN|nr:hypothetical protein [Actinoplanes regularis]GIE86821.1 hypothetical protein Are01nite_33010 [Actinoplanes regularis]SNR58171.1 hypothetical protein SAMN06264365_103447 [Actinoplanes regularis]